MFRDTFSVKARNVHVWQAHISKSRHFCVAPYNHKLQSYSPMYLVCLCMSIIPWYVRAFPHWRNTEFPQPSMHTVPFDLDLKQLIINLNYFSERSVKNAGCQVIDEVFSSEQHNSHLCRAGRLCRLSSIPLRSVYITVAHTENLLSQNSRDFYGFNVHFIFIIIHIIHIT